MSFQIGCYQMPVIKCEQRQTLLKICPHCGIENEVGSIREDDHIIVLCWGCKEPLFHKDAKFILLPNQNVIKFTTARKPEGIRGSRGKLVNKTCLNCGMENRAGENEVKGVINGIIMVCGSCYTPLCGSIGGKDYLKIKFRKAKLVKSTTQPLKMVGLV